MRARLRLVRHGEASAADAGDPGLSVRGIRQALDLPATMTGTPERLVASPLIRARETALPLAAAFALERRIEPDYGELPWRDGQTAAERADEIARMIGASWMDLDADRRGWRARLIDRALSESGDVVIVSHFVAINALVGLATGDDRAVIFHPATASVTEFALGADGGLEVVSLGTQAPLPLEPSHGGQEFPS